MGGNGGRWEMVRNCPKYIPGNVEKCVKCHVIMSSSVMFVFPQLGSPPATKLSQSRASSVGLVLRRYPFCMLLAHRCLEGAAGARRALRPSSILSFAVQLDIAPSLEMERRGDLHHHMHITAHVCNHTHMLWCTRALGACGRGCVQDRRHLVQLVAWQEGLEVRVLGPRGCAHKRLPTFRICRSFNQTEPGQHVTSPCVVGPRRARGRFFFW